MSVNNAVNELTKFFNDLTATSPVCVALGTTLTQGSNLFNYEEPQEATQMITSIPYGGAPPLTGDKYESSVQVRVKAKSNAKAFETSQAIINTLDRNNNVCASSNGMVLANQSMPIMLPAQEQGEWSLTVSNYIVRHAKF